MQAARSLDPGLSLLHATIAIEGLVSGHEPGPGAKARLAGRIVRLLPGIDLDLLEDLYAGRSEVAHQGFTRLPFETAADLADEALSLGQRAILAANALIDSQALDREREYLQWLA